MTEKTPIHEVDEVNEVKPKTKFRISAKNLSLTYSQVPSESTKEELLKELQAKVNFRDYVIGRELHKDGGVHYHAVIMADKKFSIRSANFLDVQLCETKHHGNYSSTRHLNASIEYVLKDGDFITSLTNIRNRKVVGLKDLLAENFEKLGRDPTLRNYFQEQTEKAFGKNLDLPSVDKVFAVLERISKSQAQLAPKPFYKIDDFVIEPNLQEWLNKPSKPTLVLVGPSGAGKTQFALALFQQLGLKVLVLNELQALNRLSAEHDAIFFDDFTFSKIYPEQLLALVETEYPKDIRLLYTYKEKQAGLMQIFALNKQSLLKIASTLSQEQFLRRIQIVKVPSDFLKNVQVNININVNVNHLNGNNCPTCQDKTSEEQDRIRQNRKVLEELLF